MRQDHLDRLTTLYDKLIERSLEDADPTNWVAGGKKPNEMTRDERGDAKWCRGLAVSTVALTMQVQRLMQNPVVGGAAVPDQPAAPVNEEETMEAEVSRYERAAAEVVNRARVAKR